MTDTLSIIKQADELREKGGDLNGSLEILNNLLDELEKDPIILAFDIPLVLKKMGNCHLDMGELEKAESTYIKALDMAKKDLNWMEETDVLTSLALLEIKKGDIEKAEQYISESFEYIGTKRGDRFKEIKANAYAVMGELCFVKEEYKEALENYKRAYIYQEKDQFKKKIEQLKEKI